MGVSGGKDRRPEPNAGPARAGRKLEKQAKKLQQGISTLEAECAAARAAKAKEASEATAKQGALEQAAAKDRQKAALLEQRLAEVEGAAAAESCRAQQHSKELSEAAAAARAEAEQAKRALQQQQAACRQRLDEAEAASTKLEQEGREQAQRAASLSAELAAARAADRRSRAEALAQAGECSGAVRMFEQMQRRYARLEGAHTELQREHGELQREHGELQREHGELMELRAVTQELEQLMHEEMQQYRLLAQTAEEQLTEFRERDAQQRAEIERLARALEGTLGKLQRAEARSEAAVQEQGQLQAQAAALQAEAEREQERARQAQKEHDAQLEAMQQQHAERLEELRQQLAERERAVQASEGRALERDQRLEEAREARLRAEQAAAQLGRCGGAAVDTAHAACRCIAELRRAIDAGLTSIRRHANQNNLQRVVQAAEDTLGGISDQLSCTQLQLHKVLPPRDPAEVLEEFTLDSDGVDCDAQALVAIIAERHMLPPHMRDGLVELVGRWNEARTFEYYRHRIRMLCVLHLLLTVFRRDQPALPEENVFVLLAAAVALGFEDLHLISSKAASAAAWLSVQPHLQEIMQGAPHVVDRVRRALNPETEAYWDATMLLDSVLMQGGKNRWTVDPIRFRILSWQVVRLLLWHGLLSSGEELVCYMKADASSQCRKAALHEATERGSKRTVPQWDIEGYDTRGKGKGCAIKKFTSLILTPLLAALKQIFPSLGPSWSARPYKLDEHYTMRR